MSSCYVDRVCEEGMRTADGRLKPGGVSSIKALRYDWT